MFLDVIMPGMPGTTVLKRVREFDKDVGIIMVTAEREEGTVKETLKSIFIALAIFFKKAKLGL